jgi:ABC-2 type transport system ATP-binding protein
MAQDMLLRFSRVCFLSGTTKLLEDVSFEICANERVALTGGILAGKSLILQLAMGLARPNSGTVDGSATQRSHHCGIVFDTISLLEEQSLRSNLRYFGMLYGMWGRTLKRRIEEVAEGLGATEILGARVTELERPQLRLADLARALIHRPRLLLIDEHIMARGSRGDEAMIGRLLESPLSEDLALLFARRHPPESGLVPRLLTLKDGSIAWNGSHHAESRAGERRCLQA